MALASIRSITSCDGKPKTVFLSSFVIWLSPNEFFEMTNTDAVQLFMQSYYFNFGLEVDLIIEDGGQRGLSSRDVSAI